MAPLEQCVLVPPSAQVTVEVSEHPGVIGQKAGWFLVKPPLVYLKSERTHVDAQAPDSLEPSHELHGASVPGRGVQGMLEDEVPPLA
eukprot:187590-Pyramimonas_sp.AAC.1